MSKPLPINHPLVQAVAKQLDVAMRMDGPREQVGGLLFGPAVLELLAELVGAAHTPERLTNEIAAIDAITHPVDVAQLQHAIDRMSAIINRGRGPVRAQPAQ